MRRIKRPYQRKKKRCLVRDMFKNRERQGAFETLFHEMCNDRELFFRYFRVSPKRLAYSMREQIEKEDTTFRKSFPAAGCLAITLHYLAYGVTQQSLSHSYRIGRSDVSTVVTETCKAIYTPLKDRYLKVPPLRMIGKQQLPDLMKFGISRMF